MGFSEPRARDAHEVRRAPQLADAAAADISHAAAQPTDHLKEDVDDGSLVGNAAFDALRYELAHRHLAFLEIAIGAAILHGRERAHTANHLEAAALEQERFARTFLGAREHRAHHHARRACRERFHDVARVLDST